MNDFLLSILLGIVEGLTEIFAGELDRTSPHRRSALQAESARQLLEDVHDCDPTWGDPALPVYFWKRILEFLATFPKGERGDRNFLTHPLGLTIVAFVVTALPSWALTKVIGKKSGKACG